jgi:hypothetical protein
MSGVIITSEYTTGDRVLYINTSLNFYTLWTTHSMKIKKIK